MREPVSTPFCRLRFPWIHFGAASPRRWQLPLLGRTFCFLRFERYLGAGHKSRSPPLASKNSNKHGGWSASPRMVSVSQRCPAPPRAQWQQEKHNEVLSENQHQESNPEQTSYLLSPAYTDAEEVRGPSGGGLWPGVALSSLQRRWGGL